MHRPSSLRVGASSRSPAASGAGDRDTGAYWARLGLPISYPWPAVAHRADRVRDRCAAVAGAGARRSWDAAGAVTALSRRADRNARSLREERRGVVPAAADALPSAQPREPPRLLGATGEADLEER